MLTWIRVRERIWNVCRHQPCRWSIQSSVDHECHCADRMAAILIVPHCQSTITNPDDCVGPLLGYIPNVYGSYLQVSVRYIQILKRVEHRLTIPVSVDWQQLVSYLVCSKRDVYRYLVSLQLSGIDVQSSLSV